jgi:GntR family transcriptional regulator
MRSSGLAGSVAVSDPPYYRRIMDDVRIRIARGEWPPGSKLPSTRELVDRYRLAFGRPDLSRLTIRRAIDNLIETGELRGQQGVGVFVAEAPLPAP